MNEKKESMLIIRLAAFLAMLNISHATEVLPSDAPSTHMVPVKLSMIKDHLTPFLNTHTNISEHDTEKMISDMLPLISWRQATETELCSLSTSSSFNGYFNSISLQPGLDQNSISIEVSDSVIQLKAKHPLESNVFLYWLFNVDTKEWQQLSKDYHVYSKDEFEQKIQALYPNCDCSVREYNYEKGRALTLITDPSDIMNQRVYVFLHRQGTVELEERKLLTINADTFHSKINIITYRGADNVLHAGRIDLSQDAMQLEEILPPQPSEIRSWDGFIFFNQSLIAEHYLPRSLERQYYRIQNSEWVLLHQGPYPAQSLQMNVEGGLQLISHKESGITIAQFDCSTNTFKPTNVSNFPIQLINGEIKVSKTGSILALQDYEQGHYVWRFPESDSGSVGSNSSAFATHEDRQREYNALIKKLSDELVKYPSYAGRKFSIESLSMNEDGYITSLYFSFPENTYSKINKCLSMVFPLDESSFSHGDAFHPPLQKHWVSGHEIPYFHVPSEGEPNGKAIVLMEGGPESRYDGSFSKVIKIFTQGGWAVIIPQESNRTGHGWKHYSKGFGEMGRKNLHQLLYVFQDAISKNLIKDFTQIYLYGHSYGGFVAASFALRWDELHTDAGLEKKFNFQSIIADAAFVDIGLAAFVDIGLQDKGMFRAAIIGTEDPMEFRQKYMPLHLICASSSLSALTTFIHGICDIRCSAEYMRQFSTALNAKGCAHGLFWHKGEHSLEHELYPAFLLAYMNGASTSEMEKDLFMLEDNI